MEALQTSSNVPAVRAGVTSSRRQGPAVRRNEYDIRPQLPSPRGPISHEVIKALSRPTGPFKAPVVRTAEVLTDEDFQLALYCCYELHYRGFDRVSDDWEWDPCLLRLRGELEEAFESGLRAVLMDGSRIAA